MVSSYLVTKAIGAGVMLVAALLVLLGWSDAQAAVGVVPPIVAGALTAATGVLLIGDLKQPMRFLYILTRPHWTSWLTKGAVVLALFAALCAAWFIAGLADASTLIEVLAIPTALLAAATAGYTAFLFAQCEGRDLWQTPLLLPMLLAQAVAAGGAAYALLDTVMDVPSAEAVRWVLLGGLIAHLVLTAVEITAHGTRNVELATRNMTRGEFAPVFWTGVAAALLAAVLTVLALTDVAPVPLAAIGGVLALVAIAASEHSFVKAGQSVPLS
jgi:formate-dependent nitrite reductase membrane component NrfD